MAETVSLAVLQPLISNELDSARHETYLAQRRKEQWIMTVLLFYKPIRSSKVNFGCARTSVYVYTQRVILIKASTFWPVSSC